MDTNTMAITSSQVRSIMISFIIIVPLAVLALGTVVWIRRRHR